MVGKLFFAKDKREQEAAGALHSRRYASGRTSRLNASAAVWLLGGITLLAVSSYSPILAEQDTSDSKKEDALRNERMEDLVDAAMKALWEGDSDTVALNARTALKLDPESADARRLEWWGLICPLPDETDGSFTYKVYQGSVVITRCKSSAAEVRIPAEIAGKPVARIGPWAFAACEDLITVTIGDSVARIDDRAFWDGPEPEVHCGGRGKRVFSFRRRRPL